MVSNSATLPLPSLLMRIAQYTNRHVQFNKRRSLLPVITIAAGTLLVYVVLTLISVVQAQMNELSGTLSAATTAAISKGTVYVAIICLIVGAMETAIVMTRSVLARIHEIGVLKATGVGDRVIFGLFIAEALTYGVKGGLLGSVLGWVAAAAVQIASGTVWTQALWPSWGNLLLAIALAVTTSVLAALLPIWRTVRLSAIQAIYYQF